MTAERHEAKGWRAGQGWDGGVVRQDLVRKRPGTDLHAVKEPAMPRPDGSMIWA